MGCGDGGLRRRSFFQVICGQFGSIGMAIEHPSVKSILIECETSSMT